MLLVFKTAVMNWMYWSVCGELLFSFCEMSTDCLCWNKFTFLSRAISTCWVKYNRCWNVHRLISKSAQRAVVWQVKFTWLHSKCHQPLLSLFGVQFVNAHGMTIIMAVISLIIMRKVGRLHVWKIYGYLEVIFCPMCYKLVYWKWFRPAICEFVFLDEL